MRAGRCLGSRFPERSVVSTRFAPPGTARRIARGSVATTALYRGASAFQSSARMFVAARMVGQASSLQIRWAVSLCCYHHREQHNIGEAAFEMMHQLDLRALAVQFTRISPYRERLT